MDVQIAEQDTIEHSLCAELMSDVSEEESHCCHFHFFGVLLQAIDTPSVYYKQNMYGTIYIAVRAATISPLLRPPANV